MYPSVEYFRLLKLLEGCKLVAYLCPAGVVTIGYGNTINSKGNPFILGDKITQEEADSLLENEVKLKAAFLNKILGKIILTQNQFDAISLFQYNCGNGALLSSSLFIKLKVNPNDKSIELEFLKWNKIKVKGVYKISKGLTVRRKAEAKLYFTK